MAHTEYGHKLKQLPALPLCRWHTWTPPQTSLLRGAMTGSSRCVMREAHLAALAPSLHCRRSAISSVIDAGVPCFTPKVFVSGRNDLFIKARDQRGSSHCLPLCMSCRCSASSLIDSGGMPCFGQNVIASGSNSRFIVLIKVRAVTHLLACQPR